MYNKCRMDEVISNDVISFLANTLKISCDDMKILIDAVDKHRWDENNWKEDSGVIGVLEKVSFEIDPVLIFRGIVKFTGNRK